jgi:ABC-type uncharacterized transport system substrate-binding protein
MKRVLLGALVAMGLAPLAAEAHPHVWVTSKSELVYDASGALVGIRQAWAFDDMFSSYAVQGLDVNNDGKLTREELQPLAETNVTTMAESDYFTFVESGGKDVELAPARDYWLDWDGTLLTLNFMLPLKTPIAKGQDARIEIYDPTFFVDFELAEKDPARLAGAPKGCALTVERPGGASKPKGPAAAMQLSEDYFNSATSQNYGEKFANRIGVTCPAS